MKMRPRKAALPLELEPDFIVCIHFLTYCQYTSEKVIPRPLLQTGANSPVSALAFTHGLNRAATVTVHGGWPHMTRDSWQCP